MCHGATKSYTGLMAARFFLGVAESAVAPGFSLLVGMFYKRKEQPSRSVNPIEQKLSKSESDYHSMCLWFIGNGVASTISGLLAYGIGQAHSSLATWRLLFIILGTITCAYGLLLLVLLPDSPAKAKFLDAGEKAIVLHRTLENKTGVLDERIFKTSQMFEELMDPQAWFLALYMFSVTIPNGGITSVCH
jgi:MFS family permease